MTYTAFIRQRLVEMTVDPKMYKAWEDALRKWDEYDAGDVFEKAPRAVDNLLVKLAQQVPISIPPNTMLYRGTGVWDDLYAKLDAGQPIKFKLLKKLSSWTYDAKHAISFAKDANENKGMCAIVIALPASRLTPIIDVNVINKRFKFRIADKDEVIVANPPGGITITPQDVIWKAAYDENAV
jgi:hypothetical protein